MVLLPSFWEKREMLKNEGVVGERGEFYTSESIV